MHRQYFVSVTTSIDCQVGWGSASKGGRPARTEVPDPVVPWQEEKGYKVSQEYCRWGLGAVNSRTVRLPLIVWSMYVASEFFRQPVLFNCFVPVFVARGLLGP